MTQGTVASRDKDTKGPLEIVVGKKGKKEGRDPRDGIQQDSFKIPTFRGGLRSLSDVVGERSARVTINATS